VGGGHVDHDHAVVSLATEDRVTLGRRLEVEKAERGLVVIVGHALVSAEPHRGPVGRCRRQRPVVELDQDHQHGLGPGGGRSVRGCCFGSLDTSVFGLGDGHGVPQMGRQLG